MLNFNKKLIFILLIIIVLIGGVIYYFSIEENNEDYLFLEENFINEQSENIQVEQKEIVEEQEIVIHITGEVVNCGIVKLKENSRIIDAIEAAGGATEDADLSKINLAFVLSDAQKIYIPSINDEEEKQIVTQGSGEEISIENEKLKQNVNINTASTEELQKLPGIGEAIASRIISYRNLNGKFQKIEDLKNVSGIGEAKFNNIKEYICVK